MFSDRSNMVQTGGSGNNFPVALSRQNLFDTDNGNALAIRFALLDQQNCGNDYQNNVNHDQNDINNCGKLNSAPNRWPPNVEDSLVRMVNTGTYYYVSTRNNNFSNRSQKGVLVVGTGNGLSPAQQAGIALGTIAACAVVFGGVLYYGKKNPNSRAGTAYQKVAACMTSAHQSVSSKLGSTGTGSTLGGTYTGTKTATAAPDMEYQRA